MLNSRVDSRCRPYGNGRKSSRLLGGLVGLSKHEREMVNGGCFHDADPLLTPGRTKSSAFVADKHVIIKKPKEELCRDAGKLGVTFRSCAQEAGGNVVISGLEAGGAAANSELLVGDVVFAIDGVPVSKAEEAVRLCGAARPGASIFITAAGGTREVTIDKRQGDCGMTCAGAGFITRGVLLKRIAKGSLADRANLYCGDTILSVNGKLVNHHSECVKAIDAVPGEVRKPRGVALAGLACHAASCLPCCFLLAMLLLACHAAACLPCCCLLAMLLLACHAALLL